MNLKALLTIALIAAPAGAESNFTHSGPYIQGGAMKLISAFAPESDTSPSGMGYMGGIGYRFSPWYALQVDYQWGEMADSPRYISPVTDVSVNHETEDWSVMGSGKLYPFASSRIRFQPYGLIGFGVMQAESSIDVTICTGTPLVCVPDPTISADGLGFAMKYGGGADIHLTDRIYGFVDYAFYHAIQDSIKPFDFHAVGGGIGFRW